MISFTVCLYSMHLNLFSRNGKKKKPMSKQAPLAPDNTWHRAFTQKGCLQPGGSLPWEPPEGTRGELGSLETSKEMG